MKNKVSVVGSINYDILIKGERLPYIGETFTVDKIENSPGGKGLNQAYQCAKLDIPTMFFGCIGNDIYGDFIKSKVNISSLDLSKLKTENTPTGMGVVNVLNDGSVYANILPGANSKVDINYIKKNIIDIMSSEFIVLQLEIPTETVEFIIEEASKHGVKVILNGAPAKEIGEEFIKKVDVFILNESEGEYYLKKSIKNKEDAIKHGSLYSKKMGIKLILTLGEMGSIYFNNGVSCFIESYKQENVVDTTGAGDSYVGAFVYAYYKGYDLEYACRFASLVSSKTIAKMGAQASMPGINEVKYDTRIKTEFNKERSK